MFRQLCIWAIVSSVIIIPTTLCWSGGTATLQRGRPNAPMAEAIGVNRSTPKGKK